tara:strand:+ start:44 stop:181 length:138 start_codon:yes stop_codon:yes gene_type:complete
MYLKFSSISLSGTSLSTKDYLSLIGNSSAHTAPENELMLSLEFND